MSQLEFNSTNSKDRVTRFVDVMLPVPIPRLFTYRVPADMNDFVRVGCRVIVQFGSRKVLTGVIGSIHTTPPPNYEAKYILDVLDEQPVVNEIQIALFKWIAGYYMCTIGEVLNVALPSGLKLSSESHVQLYPDFDFYDSEYDFSDKEQIILNLLRKNDSLTYGDISKALGVKNIFIIIKSLVSKQAIILYEQVKEKYKPKKESRIRLNEKYRNKEQLEELFESLVKRPKQEEVLLEYLKHIPVYHNFDINEKGVKKNLLQIESLSASALKTLTKNEVFEEFEKVISRFPDDEIETTTISLTDDQERAKEEILSHYQQEDICLLHGITGSGKTEVYISLIEHVIENGSQVLYLLPEIALTTQIVNRLKKVFGNKVGIYHSKFSDNERVEVWNGVLSGRYQLILGVRSSIFLPFDNLGLIVVDEEHESSYKQYDPAPRYNARDVALFLARKHHSKVLLGSATPSIESFYQAGQGKYKLVTMTQRYGSAGLPEFIMGDVLREGQKKTMQADFTTTLVEQIGNALDADEQVIIFQNRRGYSPYITCMQCAHIPKCDNCAVSLTYHQYRQQLICHYCGYHEPMPSECEACGSKELKTIGIGTEKLEENLSLLFPKASIQRMDLDTTRNKNSYERIIGDFENRDIDILVGTQMVTKGLDFDHVSLVGVYDLDSMLHFPDFRSTERTFQLTTQVSGRAGRRSKKGKVVIQTRDISHDIIRDIKANDFNRFYDKEITERERHRYPPFTRLISITVKHKDKAVATKLAMHFANLSGEQLGFQRVLGPQEPFINRIRNEYISELLIKLERGSVDLTKVKSILQQVSDELLLQKDFKQGRIIFDVDPY